jgi:TfoX/Sxy family transcriptional regulator of competence genes
MPHDPELAERIRGALNRRAGIDERRMFGGYCWMLNGNMLCGVEVGRYMFRVGKELEPEALARPGASPMDITGRPMKGFVWVRAAEARGKALESWIELAMSFVATLPPKQKIGRGARVRKRRALPE